MSFPNRLFYTTLFSLCMSSTIVSADTCSTIKSRNSQIEVLYPNDITYKPTLNQYWSQGCATMYPSCIILPRTTQQVSNIIKILNQNNETFSVKSGGHMPNRGYNSIQGGPLINTQYMNEIIYNKSVSTVRIGPGNRWHNVTAALQNTGMNVVGGRIGNVGTAGLILGGITPRISSPQILTTLRRLKLYERGIWLGREQRSRI
jgi:hypothetical protein